MPSMNRERRWWTAAEDEVLQDAALAQENEHGSIKDWSRVCANLPGRTNKDCRKRWDKVRLDIRKGPWTSEEDQTLRDAVTVLGTRWSLVALRLQSRNADQCSKRWRQVLDPNCKRAPWTAEEDETLRNAVLKYGNDWKRVRAKELPDRSAHDVRNRSVALERRIRRKTDNSDSDSFALTILDDPVGSAPCSPDDEGEEGVIVQKEDESSPETELDSLAGYVEDLPCSSEIKTPASRSDAMGEALFNLEDDEFGNSSILPDDFGSLLSHTGPWGIGISPHQQPQINVSPAACASVSKSGIGYLPTLERSFDASMHGTTAGLSNAAFSTFGHAQSLSDQGTFTSNAWQSLPPAAEECRQSRKRSITVMLQREDAAMTQEILNHLVNIDAELTIKLV